MNHLRVEKLKDTLFKFTAPAEIEHRELIINLLHGVSEFPEYFERLEKMEPSELLRFFSSLKYHLPLDDISDLGLMLDGKYENFTWEPTRSNKIAFNSFKSNIQDIAKLLELNDVGDLRVLWNLTYVQIITSIEAYLGDSLKKHILVNHEAISNILKSDSELSKERISLYESFVNPNCAKKTVSKYLDGIIYHNFMKVIALYRISIGANINFPSEIVKEVLLRAVQVRHDIVHRTGFTVEGKKISISKVEVQTLLATAEEYVNYVENIISV